MTPNYWQIHAALTMKFYTAKDIPTTSDDVVFRASTGSKIIAIVIFYGLTFASLWLAIVGWRPEGMTPGFFYYFAVVVGLFGLIPINRFRASLKPENWLLRCGREEVIVNFRSYLNWRLPSTGPHAVGFAYGEIAWAKKLKEYRITPSRGTRGGNESSNVTFLELGLGSVSNIELEAQLSRERKTQADGVVVSMDYPVQLVSGNIVQIRWGADNRPSLRRALEVLGRRVNIAEAESVKVDLTHHRGGNETEEKAKIITLARSGDEMGAAKLAQQTYGYSLSEAIEFVDKLLSDS